MFDHTKQNILECVNMQKLRIYTHTYLKRRFKQEIHEVEQEREDEFV